MNVQVFNHRGRLRGLHHATGERGKCSRYFITSIIYISHGNIIGSPVLNFRQDFKSRFHRELEREPLVNFWTTGHIYTSQRRQTKMVNYVTQAKAVKDVHGAVEVICDRFGESPTSPELATEIFKMMCRLMKSDWDAGIEDGVIEELATARRSCDDLYWQLDELMDNYSNNKKVARYALQAISYLAMCQEGREGLVGIGFCRHVEEMMRNFGQKNGDLAEWGFCAIQALTCAYEEGRKGFSSDVPAMLIRVFKTHVKTSSIHPGVAKMSLYAIANLSKERNIRTQFNADGASDLITSRIISNPLITDEKVK